MDDDEEHYFTIDGRRWRKTDPGIPEALRSELVKELMAARRAVKAARSDGDDVAERAARARVSDAKIALGERGAAWWQESSDAQTRARARAVMRTLLRQRGAEKTICPSDVARVLAGAAFRGAMALVRGEVNALARAGALRVLQKGHMVDAESARGPIRIALPHARPAPDAEG